MRINRNGNKPIDVLLLAKHDWANTGFRFWKCLLSLGLNAIMFKGDKHMFGYPVEAPIHPSLTSTPLAFSPLVVMAPGLESLIESAHVVHLTGSTWPLVALDWSERKVVVQHGGTSYRLDPDACNATMDATMDPHASATIIQCPDLLNLGASNEHWIYYPVDTDFIQPDFSAKHPKRLVVGHFPSDPMVKGTETILKVLKKFEGSIEYLGITNFESWEHHIPWEANLERMKPCDIIIETMAPLNHGKPFGEWGNTALEAAALGKIVITNSQSVELYREEYGVHPQLCIANNGEELEERLMELLGSGEAEIGALKEDTRTWAEEHHSIEATAKRLWDLVYRGLF
jgi:glycosyltransferase involved in cell wall biosynthesis